MHHITASPGLHHVTLMASDAQRNLDFYTRVLGLRLVKKTVNFDDPSLYHLYFSDRSGTPGAVLTFFPIPHAAPGHIGAGEASQTILRAPTKALAFWSARFKALNVDHDSPAERFGKTTLSFRDSDGARFALTFTAQPTDDIANPWTTDEIGADNAICGLHGVTLLLQSKDATAHVLTNVFGYSARANEGAYTRYSAPSEAGTLGRHVDLQENANASRGRMGAGSVHHIAFRAKTDADAFAMKAALDERLGVMTTEQKDRSYFRSIYFREPGGVLFEIATDEPGFLIDETQAELGSSLKLPPAYEAYRGKIESTLPALKA
jgi:glyoxalase family protein